MTDQNSKKESVEQVEMPKAQSFCIDEADARELVFSVLRIEEKYNDLYGIIRNKFPPEQRRDVLKQAVVNCRDLYDSLLGGVEAQFGKSFVEGAVSEFRAKNSE